MMKLKSAFFWAVLSGTAALAAGCGGTAAVREDWEAELRGGLSLECRNLDHLGYGLHYDIVLDPRQATTQEAARAPLRAPGRLVGGRHGE